MKANLLRIGCLMMITFSLFGCGSKSSNEIGENDYNVDGVYQMEVDSGDSDSTVFAYAFSKKDMSFKESITIGEADYELASGSYEIDQQNDLVHTTTDKDVKQDFVIYGKYLIADGFFYDGEIPDGKTFDVTCEYTGEAGNTSKITFRKDGTFSFAGSNKSEGTYERDGSLILITTNDGSSLVDYIIYKGRICNSYFKKI